MSVSSTTNRVTFSGNGSTTAFSFPYFFYATTDLLATVTDSSGNITTPTYSVSGTAAGNGSYPSGGTVTFSAAPATGSAVTIYRDPDQSQGVDLTDNVAELALDKLTLLVQRLVDRIGRAVRLQDGFTATFDPTLPTVMTANKLLAVNSSGNGLTLVTSASSGGTVTSVDLSLPAIFSVSGNPVTVSGTLSATLASQTTNKVFAAPNGSTGTPTFRALVAADIPQSSLTITSMSSGAATSGQVPVANGSGAIAWQSITGTGTVTSVAMTVPNIFSLTGSPVTTSGTLALSLASQTKNTVFAGPASGSNAAPSFRVLVGADIPAFTGAGAGAGGSLGGVPVPASGQQGTFLRGDGTWASVPGGTVTSVDLVMPAEFSVAGDPVTGSGTITVSKANQAANKIYAGPGSGSAASPTFRSLAASDLPLFTGSTGLASGVAGGVPAPAAGQQGYFLRGDGAWAPGGSGGGGISLIPTVITADYSVIATDTFVLANSSSTINITLPDATSVSGMQVTIKVAGTGTVNLLTTSSQTIDGQTSQAMTAQFECVTLTAVSGAWYLC